MHVLAVSNVVKVYSKRKVVDRVSLDVKMGEIVGLLGPNGAGKTTTFYMVVGLVVPDEGRILLSGKDITNYPMYQRAREAIGYLAQEPSVFRKMTVEQNIRAILEFTKLSKNDQDEKLEILLEDLNIARLRNNYGYSLSGGERRRVEIARSLATNPNFILLDEPFAGVDPIAVSEIQGIIKRLKEKGLGVLITDHSVRETLEITDRAYIMSEGKVLVSGTSEEISNSEIARKIYLGENFKIDGIDEAMKTLSDKSINEESENIDGNEIKILENESLIEQDEVTEESQVKIVEENSLVQENQTEKSDPEIINEDVEESEEK